MNYKVSSDFIQKLETDIDRKRLGSGMKLGGSISENKIKLYVTDDYGKHSNFASRIFYAKLNGNILIGNFSVSYYVIALLGILAGFCVESIVAAIIRGAVEALVFPIVILLVELVYLLSLKKISAVKDSYIIKYLEACVED